MNTGLTIAGLACVILAVGHTFVGRSVLARLPRNLRSTPFGDGAFTRGVIVFTWHGLGLMLAASGAVLLGLARSDAAAGRAVAVFLIGAVYAAATLIFAWVSRRRPADLFRAPVWVLFVIITALCWMNV